MACASYATLIKREQISGHVPAILRAGVKIRHCCIGLAMGRILQPFFQVLRGIRESVQKDLAPGPMANEGALFPSPFGTPGMTWQEIQEYCASFLRPSSGLPPVMRAPLAKSKSRNQLQAGAARSNASRIKIANVHRLGTTPSRFIPFSLLLSTIARM